MRREHPESSGDHPGIQSGSRYTLSLMFSPVFVGSLFHRKLILKAWSVGKAVFRGKHTTPNMCCVRRKTRDTQLNFPSRRENKDARKIPALHNTPSIYEIHIVVDIFSSKQENILQTYG